VVIDKKYAGYIVISDSLKADAVDAVKRLIKMGINTVMLTGDNNMQRALMQRNSVSKNIMPNCFLKTKWNMWKGCWAKTEKLLLWGMV